MSHLLRCFCALSLLLAGGLTAASAQAPTPPDPLLALVPPQAAAVILFDLRPETESAQVLAAAQPREQRDALNALALLGLQVAITQAAPGLDVEKDILPLLSRRGAICVVRQEGKRERPAFLLELSGSGTAAAAGFDRFVQAAVKAGTFEPAEAIAGVPAWQARKGGKGTVLARLGSVVVLSENAETVQPLIQRMKAPAPMAPAALALATAPAGAVRLGGALPPGEAKGLPGVTAVAGSLRLGPDSVVAEAVLPLTREGNQGPWPALAMVKPTFGESIAAVPASASAVLVAERPSVIFQAFGIPFVDGVAGGFVGPDATKPMAKVAAPFLSDTLAQEVAVALFPSEKGLGWLGVLTSSRPDTARAQIESVAKAGQGAKELQWTPDPLGADPAWRMRAALNPAKPPVELHVGVVGPRALIASDRAILEAAAATARGEAGSAAKAEWYTTAVEKLGPHSLLRLVADVKGVGRTLASFAASKGKITPRYATRAADALLVAFGVLAAGVRVEGAAVRGTVQVGVDYQKLSAVGGPFPAVGALLLSARAASATTAVATARGDARQAACTNNMKQLCMATMMFAQDWGGKLPPAVGWADVLEPYYKQKTILRCPADAEGRAFSYAFNSALAELPLAQIKDPAHTVLFYETSSTKPSPSGTGADLPNPPRHGGIHVVGFADGHVEAVAQVEPGWFKAAK